MTRHLAITQRQARTLLRAAEAERGIVEESRSARQLSDLSPNAMHSRNNQSTRKRKSIFEARACRKSCINTSTRNGPDTESSYSISGAAKVSELGFPWKASAICFAPRAMPPASRNQRTASENRRDACCWGWSDHPGIASFVWLDRRRHGFALYQNGRSETVSEAGCRKKSITPSARTL